MPIDYTPLPGAFDNGGVGASALSLKMDKSANLSDVASRSTAQTNLIRHALTAPSDLAANELWINDSISSTGTPFGTVTGTIADGGALAAETTARQALAVVVSNETTRASGAEALLLSQTAAASTYGALLPRQAVTTASTLSATVGKYYPLDTTSNAIVVALPGAPADKSQVRFKVIARPGTNNVTINRSGSDVFNSTGGASGISLSTLYQATTLQYDATSSTWTALSDDLALSQTDLRYGITINVKDPAYGAKGDGVTDDTAAIQAAITALGTGGYAIGKQVYFPSGTYKISSAISIPFATGWRIEGASRGSVTLTQATDNTPIFKLTGNLTHSWQISDLSFTWANAQPGTNTLAIAVLGATGTANDSIMNWQIRRCSFYNGFRAISHNATNAPLFWGVHISDCVHGGSMKGAFFFASPAGTGLPNIKIENCYIDSGSSPVEPSIQIDNGDNITLQSVEFNNGYYAASGGFAQINIGTAGMCTIIGCKTEAAVINGSIALWQFPNSHVNVISASCNGLTGYNAGSPASFVAASTGGFLNVFGISCAATLTGGGVIFPYGSDNMGIISGVTVNGSASTNFGLAAGASAVYPKLRTDNLANNYTRYRGDADVTLTVADGTIQYFNTTLTANRSVVLPTTNQLDGMEYTIVRYATGDFTLNVRDNNTNKHYAFGANTKGFVRYRWTGSEWVIVGSGTYTGVSGTNFGNATAVKSISANYTALQGDLTILATGGSSGITVTLPAVSPSQRLEVKKVDSAVGAVTISPASGTIDGAANTSITAQYDSFTLVSDGTNWYIV